MTNAKELLNGRFGKESQSISNVVVDAICKKLRELGVEIIEVFSDKIEFEWYEHICSYKNRTFYCGTNGMLTIENISDLNTIGLDCLVGKLTDEQLTRVGNLIVLFESDIDHCLNQKKDLKYLEMKETPFYRFNNEALQSYNPLVKKLKKTLQTGFLEEFKSSYIKTYILLGKGIEITKL